MELERTPRSENREKMEIQSFDRPKEIRNFQKGFIEIIEAGGFAVSRATFEPGWKWSEHVQPIAKTNSCEAPHFQYHISGVLMIRMDSGEIYQCRAGDVSVIPPGHDSWVVGDEPVVVIDFHGLKELTKSP